MIEGVRWALNWAKLDYGFSTGEYVATPNGLQTRLRLDDQHEDLNATRWPSSNYLFSRCRLHELSWAELIE